MVVVCSLCSHCTSLEVQAEGWGGGGEGGLKKGYTLEMFVFAIPDIHPISTQEMEIGCRCLRPHASTFPF